MHTIYTRENELLTKYNMTEETINTLANALNDPSLVDDLKKITAEYNRGTKSISIPIEEVEHFMSDLIITANRWRELSDNGEQVTIYHVVQNVMSIIGLFDACIYKQYIDQ